MLEKDLKVEDLLKPPYRIRKVIVENILERGITTFYPPQSAVIKESKMLEGENTLIIMQTASGKTLLAEIAMLHDIMKGGKVVYTVPLIALASEKEAEFTKNWKNIRVLKLVGDRGGQYTEAKRLDGSKADLIITSNEKLDSLLRHDVKWLKQITMLVIDEIHLIIDPTRGPTIEVIYARLKELAERLDKKIQVIGLSATLGKAEDVAKWLGATLTPKDEYMKEWRPVELRKGAYNLVDNSVYWLDPTKSDPQIQNNFESPIPLQTPSVTRKDAQINLALQSIKLTGKETKQVLIFVDTRKNAKKIAIDISKPIKEDLSKRKLEEFFSPEVSATISPYLTPDDREALRLIVEKLKEKYVPTDIDKELHELILTGVVYHHAGLKPVQRRAIEEGFLEGHIKIIVATPTLAAGVNLPASTVIITTSKRWVGAGIRDWLPIYEIYQMMGRAGRPDFAEKVGNALIMTTSDRELYDVERRYIYKPKIEDIVSHFKDPTPLRMHLLAYIATGKGDPVPWAQLITFLSSTFWGFEQKERYKKQPEKDREFRDMIKKVLDLYQKEYLVEYVGEEGIDAFKATPLGIKVSKLYVDPLSAIIIKNTLFKAERENLDITNVGWLQLLATTPDMFPIAIGKRDDRYKEIAFREESSYTFLTPIPECPECTPELDPRQVAQAIYDPYKSEKEAYLNYLMSLKITMVMFAWINEKTDKEIHDMFQDPKVLPGDVYRYREVNDWLLYASSELAKQLGFSKDILTFFEKLRIQVRYGAGDHLLWLIEIEGVGRVRAHNIYEYFGKIVGRRNPKIMKDIEAEQDPIEKRKLMNEYYNLIEKEIMGLALREKEAVDELRKIPTIGPKIARNIVEYLKKRQATKS
jgi:helicase